MKKQNVFASFMFVAALGAIAFASGPSGALFFQHPSLYPAVQVIAEGGTINADACGGLKRISSTAARTTSTSYTIGTLSANARKAGCRMEIVNDSTFVITLDDNSSFVTPHNANVVLGTKHSASVLGMGSYWLVLGTQNSVAH